MAKLATAPRELSDWLQKCSRNKYGNNKTEYNGVRYDSAKEAAYAQDLDLRLKGKDIADWQRQIRIPIRVNGQLICTPIVDFEIKHNDGTRELVEIKGVETKDYILKKKLILAVFLHDHPGYRYTVIK